MKNDNDFSSKNYDELLQINQATLTDRQLAEFQIELLKHLLIALDDIYNKVDTL